MRLELDSALLSSLEAMAGEEGVTIAEILRRGLSVIKALTEQRRAGLGHLGFVSDR
jgi:hypothetical protein|nr:hypothetical protein [Neorhizobium tomejilense]